MITIRYSKKKLKKIYFECSFIILLHYNMFSKAEMVNSGLQGIILDESDTCTKIHRYGFNKSFTYSLTPNNDDNCGMGRHDAICMPPEKRNLLREWTKTFML